VKLGVEEGREFDVYPVGLLRDLIQFDDQFHLKNRRQALRTLWRHLRRSWRRRNYWNGYLAEHRQLGTRCGHGWTRSRAYRDLLEHLDGKP
jgi:hypothetical protein